MVAADIVDPIDRQTQQSEIVSVEADRPPGQARLRISPVTGQPSAGAEHQDRSRFNERRRTRAHFQFPVAFAGSQGLHHAARHLRGIAGIGPPLISRLRLHAGLEVVMEQSATQLVDRLGVDDMRWHEEYRGAKRHRLEIHEAEEIPEQGVFDQSLRSSSSVMGTITSSIPRGLPNVSSLATSVSAKRLNWTSLSGLIAGIMGPARPVWIGGDRKNIDWRLEPFTSAPAHRSSTADALALVDSGRRRIGFGRADRGRHAPRRLVPAPRPGADRLRLHRRPIGSVSLVESLRPGLISSRDATI